MNEILLGVCCTYCWILDWSLWWGFFLWSQLDLCFWQSSEIVWLWNGLSPSWMVNNLERSSCSQRMRKWLISANLKLSESLCSICSNFRIWSLTFHPHMCWIQSHWSHVSLLSLSIDVPVQLGYHVPWHSFCDSWRIKKILTASEISRHMAKHDVKNCVHYSVIWHVWAIESWLETRQHHQQKHPSIALQLFKIS